jgi:hypothetical protein
MKLIEEIIDTAVTETEPLSTLLRRCLVLEHRVKNRKLKSWVNKELDGYEIDDRLPDYRKVRTNSQGFLVGVGGTQINNQPLSLYVMEEKHREMMATLALRQPISSYDMRPNKESDALIPWPPHLTIKYQSSFYPEFVLNRAWQVLPDSVLAGLIDTVRNRVLRFSLEFQDDLGEVDDNLSKLAPAKIEQSVINNIYGGNNVIAASAENIQQISNITVTQNDLAALTDALKTLGIGESDLQQLTAAIDQDSNGHSTPTLGAKVKGWLKDFGTMVGKEGLKVGVEIAKKVTTKWIMQYYGFDI